MRVAAIQLTASADKEQNLAHAATLIAEAAGTGAELVVLPELFNCMGSRADLLAGAEPEDGLTTSWAAQQAQHNNLWLVAGSIAEQRGSGRLSNTSCLLSPDGVVQARYRKVHLFDNDVPGAAFRESATFTPGDRVVLADAGGVPVGMTICFDLRFPEQFRALAMLGARVVVVPAAFTAATGPPHWEVLLRARAIEQQVFIVAADQVGSSSPQLHWHGHSMIVDPWGTIIAELTEPVPGVLTAELDFARQDEIRLQLRALANRRPDVYDLS